MENEVKTFTTVKKMISKYTITDVVCAAEKIETANSEKLAGLPSEGYCPFHEDKESGSFKMTDNGNKGGIYKCFCCGASGDKVDFVKNYFGVDFKEAVYRIALMFGDLTDEEYRKLSKNPIAAGIVQTESPKIHKKIPQAKKFPDWYLDDVYKAMVKISGLSSEHELYLLNRGIKEENLKNYFTMPEFNEDFFRKLEKEGYRAHDLVGVPGFYVERNDGEIIGHVRGRNLPGIGIPLKNVRGEITAIQIRKDDVPEKTGTEDSDAEKKSKKRGTRYVFFSSTSNPNGCSSGVALDIQNPFAGKYVLITEGHFKAEKMSEYFKSAVISVQGVNNTKNLDSEIPELLEKRSVEKFIIAFDADMMHNEQVKKAAVKLKKQLEKFGVPTGFLVWDEKYGKGADDVIIAGNQKYFKFIENMTVEED